VEQLMSFHNPKSDLSRLNHSNPGTWVKVNSLSSDVFRKSNELYRTSNGAFDIRSATLLSQWKLLPSVKRCHLKFDNGSFPLEINSNYVRKCGNWIMDLGGIAKGFAVDRAIEKMASLTSSLRSVTVNAGGDIRFLGVRKNNLAIRIFGKKSSNILPIQVGQSAIATSSVRTQTTSTKTGTVSFHVKMPQGIALQQEKTVTVFANTCLVADALTKVALLGSREVVKKCFLKYNARALLFGPNGKLIEVISA
jgi:thiamine biosynthesis lipoprotein